MTHQSQVMVADHPEKSRFEVTLDGVVVGFAAYEKNHETVIFTHTEVSEGYEGRGLAGQLAKAALGMARHTGYKVVPRCPYIRSYVRKHAPEYNDLLLRPPAS